MPSLKQRGDTIVEVLMVVAVISGVLGTAYAITNRSVKSNQLSQERGQAVKVAETQIEQLRTFKLTDVPGGTFCVTSGAFESDLINCKFDNNPGDGRYSASVTQPSPGKFVITVTWRGATNGSDQVAMNYRMY